MSWKTLFAVHRCLACCAAVLLWGSALAASAAAPAQPLSREELAKIVFDQKLMQPVSLDLEFRDENGRKVQLQDYFDKKPVIVVLGYYECPMLCSIVLNGLVEALQDLKWNVGEQFDIINVSINPHEAPALAAAKKRTYLKRYPRAGAEQGWHFLTGKEPAIRKLADEVGFHYAYDPVAREYAHPSGFVILTPQGTVSRYFFGVSHAPRELQTALRDAASNKAGSPVQQLLFLCFHYNPITGKHGALIMMLVRILGLGTVLGLVCLIVAMARREKLNKLPLGGVAAQTAPNTDPSAQQLAGSKPEL